MGGFLPEAQGGIAAYSGLPDGVILPPLPIEQPPPTATDAAIKAKAEVVAKVVGAPIVKPPKKPRMTAQERAARRAAAVAGKT